MKQGNYESAGLKNDNSVLCCYATLLFCDQWFLLFILSGSLSQ